jgi:hypothetical protein
MWQAKWLAKPYKRLENKGTPLVLQRGKKNERTNFSKPNN